MQINEYLPECPICYEVLKEDLVTSSSCGHVFHSCCLEKWMGTNNICPICRRIIRNRTKLIYQFNYKTPDEAINPTNIDNLSNSDTKNDLIKENLKLIRDQKILSEEKVECENQLKYLNEQLKFYAEQFAEVNQNMKEYKNKIISLSYKLEEGDKNYEQLKEESEIKERKISELEKSIKEMERKFEMNKGIIELSEKLEANQDEVSNIKRTVEDFMKKQDGSLGLINFIFVLNQRIKNYQEELEKMKKKNSYSADKPENIVSRINNKDLLTIIPDNGMYRNTGGKTVNIGNPNVNSYSNVCQDNFNNNNNQFFKKRKFGDLPEDKSKCNENGSKTKKDNSNRNTTKISDLVVEDMYNHTTSDAISTSSYSLGNSISSINTNFVKLQHEQKVNIDSNGIVNPLLSYRNKMTKTYEANGSPMDCVDKSTESNSNEISQFEINKEKDKFFYEQKPNSSSSSELTNPFINNQQTKGIPSTNSSVKAQLNSNISNTKDSFMSVNSNNNNTNNNISSNTNFNTNKQSSIENFTKPNNFSNGNTQIYGKSVNISNNGTLGLLNNKTSLYTNSTSGVKKTMAQSLLKNNFSLKYSFMNK